MIIHDDIQLIRDRISEAKNIAVFAHIRPDGDSIGSSLAIGWALSDMGKTVQFISENEIPERFHFLFQFTDDGKDPYVREPKNADCYIIPDISSPDRAGKFFLEHPEITPDICIDHHVSNTGFAKLNWIEPDSPAACCVMTELLPQLGVKLTKRISSALLCGIITDTNSFSNTAVTSDSLRAAADLVDNGADIYSICRIAHKEHTMIEMDLYKLGMNNIHIEGELIWSVLRKADYEAIGYNSDEETGFVSYMGNSTGMKVSVLFTEISDNEVKISWRSQPGYDVAAVAVAAGGGGHAAASGATVRKPLEEAIPEILDLTKRMLFDKPNQ